MLLCHPECISRFERFRFSQRPIVEFVKHDAFTCEIDKEGLAIIQKVADLAGAMHDKADGCLDLLVPHQPVCCLVPVLGIGQFLVADDDKNVEVRAVAFRRMWFIHPGATRVRTEQNDFENPPVFLGIRLRALDQISKLFLNNSDDARVAFVPANVQGWSSCLLRFWTVSCMVHCKLL